jgi:glutamine cyclotransferase
MQRTRTRLVLQQLFLLICTVILLGSCGGRENIEDGFFPPDSIQHKVPVIINQIPHDTQAYTQGLLYYNGFLYESTGLNCCSSIRKLDASSGMLVNRVDFSNKFQTTKYFGEGLARKENELVQLTWSEEMAFVWQFPGPYSTLLPEQLVRYYFQASRQASRCSSRQLE